MEERAEDQEVVRTKICTKCKIEKPTSEFYIDKNGIQKTKDGFHGRCKRCEIEYASQWNKNNHDRYRKNTDEWIENNREHVNATVRKRRADHLEEIRAWDNAYARTMKGAFNDFKSRAKYKGIFFDLTFEQFISFWEKPCYYCTNSITKTRLDRVDNSRGYTIDNVVSCCTHCNTMKRNLSQKDFFDWVLRIVLTHNLAK